MVTVCGMTFVDNIIFYWLWQHRCVRLGVMGRKSSN